MLGACPHTNISTSNGDIRGWGPARTPTSPHLMEMLVWGLTFSSKCATFKRNRISLVLVFISKHLDCFLDTKTKTREKMKKTIFILLLSLGWMEVVGQVKYPPILPYRENDYSLQEVVKFASGDSDLANSWRQEFVQIIDGAIDALLFSSTRFSTEDLSDILKLSSRIRKEIDNPSIGLIENLLSFVEWEYGEISGEFENSRNISGVVSFFPDKNFRGEVAVFKTNNLEVVLFKTRCVNLLKVPPVFKNSLPSQQTQIEPEAEASPPPVISLIENDNNGRDSDDGRFDASPFIPLKEDKEKAPERRVEIERSWIQRNWYVIPVAAVGVGGIIYSIIRFCRTGVGPIDKHGEDRTMPPGIGGIRIPLF